MGNQENVIQKNNDLRMKLTPANEEYYSNMLVYGRTKVFFYPEKEMEALFLEILIDMLSAQDNGESGEDFFGKEPKSAIDELLRELPPIQLKERLSYIWLVFGISSFFSLFNSLNQKEPSINIITLLINAGLSFIGVYLVFKWLNYTIYKEKSMSKKKEFIVLWGISSLLLVGFVGSLILGNHMIRIMVSPWLALFLVWGSVIGYLIYIVWEKEKEHVGWWLMLVLLSVISTLNKLPELSSFFESSLGKGLSVGIIVMGLILINIYQVKLVKHKDI